MDRKYLIQLYLEAEATPAQERELAESFAVTPPADDEEMAVWRMIQAVKPIRLEELPRTIVMRPGFWGLSLAGVAAAIAAVVIFTGKPERPDIQASPENEYMDLIQQIAFISNFNPAEADNFEFKPVGDGFVMTAHFPDGQSASYILTPLDGGASFNLVSLNQ